MKVLKLPQSVRIPHIHHHLLRDELRPVLIGLPTGQIHIFHQDTCDTMTMQYSNTISGTLPFQLSVANHFHSLSLSPCKEILPPFKNRNYLYKGRNLYIAMLAHLSTWLPREATIFLWSIGVAKKGPSDNPPLAAIWKPMAITAPTKLGLCCRIWQWPGTHFAPLSVSQLFKGSGVQVLVCLSSCWLVLAAGQLLSSLLSTLRDPTCSQILRVVWSGSARGA